MTEGFVIDGVDLNTAPFEEILALPGIGKARMQLLMEQVGRSYEYEMWQKPFIVGDIEVTQSDIRSYGNLTALMTEMGYDQKSPMFPGANAKEKAASCKAAFEKARKEGKITDYQIAEVIARMKKRKAARQEEEAAKAFENTAGVRRENLSVINERIVEQFDDLQRDYVATTADARKQLLHAATLLTTRELLQETATEVTTKVRDINEMTRYSKVLGEMTSQIRNMTSEINGILSQFKKQSDIELGPQQYVTQTLAKGKQIMDVFSVPVQCPKCNTRYGVVMKFFPKEIVEFPVIDFVCPVKHPDGKECKGRVHVDIDEHLAKNKVVKFTHQEYFDPDTIARELLEEENAR